MDYRAEYKRWLEKIEAADDLVAEEKSGLLDELRSMDEAAVEDAFYRNLAFGTGGLRGTLGAGCNRMNVITVAKASQGLANYLLRTCAHPSVVIGYDSRLKSDVFQRRGLRGKRDSCPCVEGPAAGADGELCRARTWRVCRRDDHGEPQPE